MNILDEISKENPRNEVVGMRETLRMNRRMTLEGAVKNWTSNIRINSLLEVLLKTVSRVDELWTRHEAVADVMSEPMELKAHQPVVTQEEWDALLAKVSDLNDRVDFLTNKECMCSDAATAFGNAENEVDETQAETPAETPKKRGGRKPATETKE